MACNKIGFQDREAATRYKLFLRRNTPHMGNKQSAKTKRKMSVYECPHCQQWHITTMSKQVRKVKYGY